MYTKDHYDRLPSMTCEMLDKYLKLYREELWFPVAWDEYEMTILQWEKPILDMPTFSSIVAKYKEWRKHDTCG